MCVAAAYPPVRPDGPSLAQAGQSSAIKTLPLLMSPVLPWALLRCTLTVECWCAGQAAVCTSSPELRSLAQTIADSFYAAHMLAVAPRARDKPLSCG